MVSGLVSEPSALREQTSGRGERVGPVARHGGVEVASEDLVVVPWLAVDPLQVVVGSRDCVAVVGVTVELWLSLSLRFSLSRSLGEVDSTDRVGNVSTTGSIAVWLVNSNSGIALGMVGSNGGISERLSRVEV